MESIAQEIEDKIKLALNYTGVEGVADMQKNVSVATTALRDSIKHQVVSEGKKINLNFSMLGYGKNVEFGNPVNYNSDWKGYEQGVEHERPGRPPTENVPTLADIKEWCTAKGIPFGKKDRIPKEILSLILKFGTRPQPFIRPFFNTKLKEVLTKNLVKAFNRTA